MQVSIAFWSLALQVTPVAPPEERHASFNNSRRSTTQSVDIIKDDLPTISMKTLPSQRPPTVVLPARASFSQPEIMSWKEISYTFDRFLFYAFSIALSFMSFVFLTVLVAGGEA